MKDLKKEIETILDGSNLYLQDYEINGKTKRGLTKVEVIEWIIETLLQEERKKTLEELLERTEPNDGLEVMGTYRKDWDLEDVVREELSKLLKDKE